MRRVFLDIFEKELGIEPLGQNVGYLVRITAPESRPVHLIKRIEEPQKSCMELCLVKPVHLKCDVHTK
jgi:hypothetical protein